MSCLIRLENKPTDFNKIRLMVGVFFIFKQGVNFIQNSKLFFRFQKHEKNRFLQKQ